MDTRIRALREDNDYTQQFVADKIGITQRKYSYIETGTQQLTAEILVALSHLYNVSVDYLLKQTDITISRPTRHKLNAPINMAACRGRRPRRPVRPCVGCSISHREVHLQFQGIVKNTLKTTNVLPGHPITYSTSQKKA